MELKTKTTDRVDAMKDSVRERFSARTKGARRRAVASGKRVSVAPYGYDKVGDKLVPNEAAKHVVKMFELRAANLGYEDIARYLNEAGVPPKRAASWGGGVLRPILANRIYMGETEYCGWDNDVPTIIQTPETAIIDRDLFERAQFRQTSVIQRPNARAPRRHLPGSPDGRWH